MKKQTKVIIATLLVVLVMVGAYFAVQQTQFGGGLTVLSMSPTSFISETTNLQGVWWLVNTMTSGGQSISGTLNPQDARVLDGGYLTKNPLSITVAAVDEKINYNIVNTGDSIYKYSLYTTKSPRDCTNRAIFGAADAPSCNSGDFDDPMYSSSSLFGIQFGNYVCQRYCIHPTQTGVIGNINPDSVVHKADITVSNGAEVIKKTVTSNDRSADFDGASGTIAHVDFTSALWTGNFAPSSANLRGFYNIYNTQQWSLTSDQHVNEYKTQKQIFETFASGAKDTIDGIVIPSSENTDAKKIAYVQNWIQQKINTVNTYSSTIESDSLSISTGQTWTNRGDKNSGKVVIDNPVQIANLNLLFRVRADWLGIVINAGKPSILSTSACNFKSGDTEDVKVTVKNVGGSSGNFNVGITCPNIKQTYLASAQIFAAGETKDMTVTLDANNKGALSEACSVKVYDTNVASNSATTSFTCQVTAPAVCQVGDFSIVDNCLKGCDSVTGTVVQKFCCASGQTILRDLGNISNSNGGYYCSSSTNQTTPLVCKPYESLKTSQETVYKWYNYIGIGSPEKVPVTQCVTSGWVYFVIFLGFAGIAVIGIIWVAKNNKKGKSGKR